MKNYAKKDKENKKVKRERVKTPKKVEVEEIRTDTEIVDEDISKDIKNKKENSDLTDDVEPLQQNVSIDPLIESEPIIKEYSKFKVTGGNVDDMPDIPEDTIERPTIDLSDNSVSNENDSELGDAEKIINDIPNIEDRKDKDTQQGNTDLDGKSKKEKNDASKYLAQTLIDGYEMAHGISLSFLSKSEEKLMKQAIKGKIDYDVIDSEIQIGSKVYQIGQLIYDYNNNLENLLTVSPEFKEEILPLLKEELARRNMGLTPMQRILAVIIKDLQPKIVQISQLTGTMNSVLRQQTEILRQNKDEIAEQRKKGNTDDVVIKDNIVQEPEEVEQDS